MVECDAVKEFLQKTEVDTMKLYLGTGQQLDIPREWEQRFPNVDIAHSSADLPESARNPVVIADSFRPDEVVRWIFEEKSKHLFQSNKKDHKAELEAVVRIANDYRLYFSNPEMLSLGKRQSSVTIEFSSPSDKARLIETCEEYVTPYGHQSFRESVRAIAEEMYMNAVIDAPKEAGKQGGDKDLYLKGKKATLDLYLYEQELIITCCDPFGSLDPHKFVARMNEVYQRGAGQVMNMKSGAGAGIGCVLMFENCTRMILGVQRGSKTVVTCVVPIKASYRQRETSKKSLHLIYV